MSLKSIRVCVVGAGPSGLSVLYHVNKMKGCTSNICTYDDNVNIDVVCYEKHSTMGGLWNMSWRVGKICIKNYRIQEDYKLFFLTKVN